MNIVEEYAAGIIKTIILMTSSGSIISIIMFALKPIIKDKLPKMFQYYMWFPAIIFFMLPVPKIVQVSIPNNFVMPTTPMHDIMQRISDVVPEKSIGIISATQNNNEQNERQIPYFPGSSFILYVFWQLGMILFLGTNIILYRKYAFHFR